MREPRFVHPNSREARQQGDACCNPPCRNSARDGKMYRCNACNVMLYCSKTCQETHWPEHKSHCEHIQEQNRVMEETSRTYSAGPVSLAQVGDELRVFLRRFGPLLLTSAVNYFRPDPRDPVIRDWEEDCLLLRINRRTDVADGVPAWARFEVDVLNRYTYEDLDAVLDEMSPRESERCKIEREKYFQEAKRRGPENGVFNTHVVCVPGHGMPWIQANYPQFFSPAVAKTDFLSPGFTPEGYLKAGVNIFSRLAAQGLIKNA